MYSRDNSKPSSATSSAGGRYALVRVRTVFDFPDVRILLYNARTGGWDDITNDDEKFSLLLNHGRDVTIGFIWHGIQDTEAIPASLVPGWLRDYIVDWVDELPSRPIIVNEGVEYSLRRAGGRITTDVKRSNGGSWD